MRTSGTKLEKSAAGKWVKPFVIGLAAFLTVFSVLLMAVSFLLMAKDLSASTILIVTGIVTALSAFAGGYTAARISRERGLMVGGIMGLLSFAVLGVASMILTKSGFGTVGLVKFLLCLLPAALGGFWGVNRKKRRK